MTTALGSEKYREWYQDPDSTQVSVEDRKLCQHTRVTTNSTWARCETCDAFGTIDSEGILWHDTFVWVGDVVVTSEDVVRAMVNVLRPVPNVKGE